MQGSVSVIQDCLNEQPANDLWPTHRSMPNHSSVVMDKLFCWTNYGLLGIVESEREQEKDSKQGPIRGWIGVIINYVEIGWSTHQNPEQGKQGSFPEYMIWQEVYC